MANFHLSLQEGFSTEIRADHTGKVIKTDAPKDHGGLGVEFSPTDLVAAALGSCILTIMGLYAKKMGINLAGTTAKVIKEQGATAGGIGALTVEIHCPQSFDASTKEKLEKGAKNCPVHHILGPSVTQKLTFHWGVTD